MKKVLLLTILFISFVNISFPQNWMPLAKGNTWQFFYLYRYGYDIQNGGCQMYQNSLYLYKIKVVDTTTIEGKQYFKINKFFGFVNGTLIRYEDSKIYIRSNGSDNVFMDFTLNNGDTLLQINPDGSFSNAQIVTRNVTAFGKSWYAKGYRKTINPGCGECWKYSDYFFADSLGIIRKFENTNTCWVWNDTYTISEALLYNPEKHLTYNYSPVIYFTPVTYVDSPTLDIDVTVKYSFESGMSWENLQYTGAAYVEGYYKKDSDSIEYSLELMSNPSLQNFQKIVLLDTILYKQGYRYYYRIKTVDKGLVPGNFYSPQQGYIKVTWKDSLMDVPDETIIVKDFQLYPNYPNPFNPSTKIKYTIPQLSSVTLKVYNLLGCEIKELVNEEKNSGSYEVYFNAEGLPSGIYFYSIRAGSFNETRPMMLIK